MKNFVQPGDTITIPAPYAVDSGQGVLAGSLFGVAAGDADNGASVDISCKGVFDIAKDAQDSFAVGDSVLFNASTKTCESSANSNSSATGVIGVAVAAAGVGAATVRVRLGAPVAIV